MLTKDVEAYYGSLTKAAEAIGLTKSAGYFWGERVPPLRAAQFHSKTRGRLKFDPADYDGYWQQDADPPDAA